MAQGEIAIGDPIKILTLEQPSPGEDGSPSEVWVPATVQYVDRDQIVAVFADGARMAVRRGRRTVRKVS